MADSFAPGFRITDQGETGLVPAAPRPYHVPIYLADSANGPLDDGGLDLARDPRQLDAFQRIGDRGEMAAWPAGAWEFSGRELRYRIAVPAYFSPDVPQTVEERRATLVAFNSFIFRPDVFLTASIAGSNRASIDLRVYDDALSGGAWPSLIFESASQSQGARPEEMDGDGLRWNRTIVFADRTWRLEFKPGAGYHGSGFWASRGVLAGGVLASMIASAYLWAMARNAARNHQREADHRAYLTDINTALETEVVERRQVEAALRQSEGRYRAMVEQIQEVIFQTDADGRWTFLNPAWSRITGYSVDDSLGRAVFDFLHPDDIGPVIARREALLRGDEDKFRMEVRYMTNDGGLRWLDVYAYTLCDETGAITGSSGSLADVTERKNLESRLAHQAFHDDLTGLPNQAGFNTRLGESLARAEATDATIVLMLMDLDGFKFVNDTHGHRAGDMLLVEVGRRLRACVRDEDMVARLGGDEFIIVIERSDDLAGAQDMAGRMLTALRPPIIWEGHVLTINASIGIALSTDADRPDPEELVRRADVALYEAKAAGKGCAIIFRDPLPRPLPNALGRGVQSSVG